MRSRRKSKREPLSAVDDLATLENLEEVNSKETKERHEIDIEETKERHEIDIEEIKERHEIDIEEIKERYEEPERERQMVMRGEESVKERTKARDSTEQESVWEKLYHRPHSVSRETESSNINIVIVSNSTCSCSIISDSENRSLRGPFFY